jgi:Ran GTPase-activating protein (RanGAP) involved in mRNA processing and transport
MALTDHDMDLVAEQAIIGKQCTLLSLQSNKITLIGISIIADALRNISALETLYLSNNYISDDGVDYLVQVLSHENYPLKTLILQKNRITDRGAQSVAQMLNVNRTLTWLYLGENAISDAGVRSLAKSIEHSNRTLEMLVLSSNKLVTDASVDDLLSMIEHNQTLKKLWIDDCNLSDVGRQRLQVMQQFKQDLYIRF